MDNAKGPVHAKRAEIRECEDHLKSLIEDRGKQQGAYHGSMPRLLKAIEQDKGFRQRPVGPLGKHLRLLKPKWSSILEKSFGGMLTAFVVTSKEDQDRLSALMRQNNW